MFAWPDILKITPFMALILLMIQPMGLKALPPYINIQERTRESDVVVEGRIEKIQKVEASKDVYTALLTIQVLKVYKGKSPAKIMLKMRIVPESWGRDLREPPPVKKTYFFFLQKSKKRDGEKAKFSPYDPTPFSFAEATEKNRMNIQLELLGP